MPLDPQVAEYLEEMARAPVVPVSRWMPEEQRQQMQMATLALGPAAPVAHVKDVAAPRPAGEIPLRVYRPVADESLLPAVVYFHGGGWVVGGIDTHDGFCRALANRAGATVVSVDYRLAPEHPFPAAVDDAFAATRWVADHAGELQVDADRISVAGDSAGGNLAAVVSILARDNGGPPLDSQTLIYPITGCDFETRSYQEYATGYFLTRDAMMWFFDQYAPQASVRRDPLVSPLLASDLSKLPRALVITAEYDPLCDEGANYALALVEARVPTNYCMYEGMIHGFARRLNRFEKSRRALEQIAKFLCKNST